MRIIGGDAKGRHIHSPKKSKARPTSDGIKESLFNILQEVSGKSFLDLFAGSGNVGLEALSRGAAKVVFVEKNSVMVKAIKKNLMELGFRNRYEIIATEAARGIRQLQKRCELFDVVFADPPYDRGFVREIFQCISEGNVISDDGMLIVQHSAREDVHGQYLSDFILTDQRRYGDTFLTFFQLKKDKKEYI